jgi:tetraacyldisaccharide 4'-kinase
MNVLSGIYASVARARRKWYARHPEARRRLARPVVSVGNISVGGSGKTPTVAHLARLLVDAGERPAILTRGYARQRAEDGVTVVSDGERVLAGLDRAGDEPLMLARALPGVPVLVSADRHLAGCLAERRFAATVHLLDDGFQHFRLERDLDLVLVGAEEIDRPITLPSGRLREPLDAARAADAIVVADEDGSPAPAPAGEPWEHRGTAERIAAALHAERVFRLRKVIEPARLVDPANRPVSPAPGTRVLAVAGIARPDRFFRSVESAGWTVAGEVTFPDHHPYTAQDMARIVDNAARARAVMVLTTEKDLVRMLPLQPFSLPVAWVPMRVVIEPAQEFRAWLQEKLGRSS